MCLYVISKQLLMFLVFILVFILQEDVDIGSGFRFGAASKGVSATGPGFTLKF